MNNIEDIIAAKDAEIALLKEGRRLHDELVDHLELVIARAAVVLEQIAMEQGRFNQDPFTHARNCIEDMKELARAALATLRALIPENKTEGDN